MALSDISNRDIPSRKPGRSSDFDALLKNVALPEDCKYLKELNQAVKDTVENKQIGSLRKIAQLRGIQNTIEKGKVVSDKIALQVLTALTTYINENIDTCLDKFPNQKTISELTDKFLEDPKSSLTSESRDDWYTTKKEDAYSSKDLVIVGAGPAGLMAAYHAIKQGRSVTLLESRSEDEFDRRPGMMHLSDEKVKTALTQILKQDFEDGDVFKHSHIPHSHIPAPDAPDLIGHRKTRKSLLKELKTDSAKIQTKVIQRILFEAIKKKSPDTVKFSSKITAVDGRSQTIMTKQGGNDKIIGFSNIIFSDGTAIFKEVKDGVVDCPDQGALLPRALLMASIGEVDRISDVTSDDAENSKPDNSKQVTQAAGWLTIDGTKLKLKKTPNPDPSSADTMITADPSFADKLITDIHDDLQNSLIGMEERRDKIVAKIEGVEGKLKTLQNELASELPMDSAQEDKFREKWQAEYSILLENISRDYEEELEKTGTSSPDETRLNKKKELTIIYTLLKQKYERIRNTSTTNIEERKKKIKEFQGFVGKYKFYIDFAQGQSQDESYKELKQGQSQSEDYKELKQGYKFWFAGNIPTEIHNQKAKNGKEKTLGEMKKFLVTLFKLAGMEKVEGSLKVDDIKTVPELKQGAEIRKTKDGPQTWVMGDPNQTSTLLKKLEEPDCKLPLLGGQAISVGDCARMPNFFLGEGTQNAVTGAFKALVGLGLEDPLEDSK